MGEIQQEEQAQPVPSSLRTLDSSLPGGRKLSHPLTILVEYDEEEVVVSEPQFHMHASAETEIEAIVGFRRVLAGYLDLLSSREETLGAHLLNQLEYLRAAII